MKTAAKMDMHIGIPVRIEFDEKLQLRYLAREMMEATQSREAGWFLKYLKAHKRSHQAIKTIIQRSHAT